MRLLSFRKPRLSPAWLLRDTATLRTQMPLTLQSAVALPVRALAWLGAQGTRAIAALVFIGIAVPPIGELLKPFVTEAIFLLLCISFMRVDLACAARSSASTGHRSRGDGLDHAWRAADHRV